MISVKYFKKGETVINQIKGYYLPAGGRLERCKMEYEHQLLDWLDTVKKNDMYDSYNTCSATRVFKSITKDMIALVWEEDANYIGEMSP